jgi:DNA-binding transcriptional ArsR family regulator
VQETFLIRDLETLKVIADPTRLAIAESCVEPSSATELAERLDLPRTRLYHHLKILQEHGLLEVVETRRVGAMTERIYQVTARRIEPAPELLTDGDEEERVEAILATIFDSTRADLARSFALGLIDLARPPSERDFTIGRFNRRLTPEQVAAFIRKIEQLEEELESTEAGGDPYTFVHVFYRSSKRRS